jgi:glycosyltransferase involved in cell wall biosynthesis
VFTEVHLIGRIREEWVEAHMPPIILNQQVKLIYQPAMSQGNLFDYLSQEQFDLNVQTSRFDSFAMVVPETMMQGIPNVVSPYVGAGEMIHDGIDGFKMPELNSVSLNRILLNYMNLNQKQRKALKEQVLNGAQHMVWENYYTNLGLVFKEILADIA